MPAARPAGARGTTAPEVSVVVPVYRNAETLPALHERLCRTLEAQALTFEILFVDDACPEGSLRAVEALAAADPRVAGLALARNVGQQRAVLAGLARARGEWMVVLDGDLQDPPEAIPGLLAQGQRGYSAVFAGRRGAYESRARLLTSRIFKRLLSLLSGVPADAGIYVAMHRTLVAQLLAMDGQRPFIVAMIGCAGPPMTSVPVARSARESGASAYSSWARLRSAWRGIAYVLQWKWRARRTRSHATPATAPVAMVVGARFAIDGSAGDGVH